MAKISKKAEMKAVKAVMAFASRMTDFPVSKLVLDFDKEADVLYVSLQRPQKATDTVELDDSGVLLRYRGKDLVGITVLDASRRK